MFIYEVLPQILVSSAGSSRSRYFSPNTNGYIEMDVYPTTLLEKSEYCSCLQGINAHGSLKHKDLSERLTALDQLDKANHFFPWVLMEVTNPNAV